MKKVLILIIVLMQIPVMAISSELIFGWNKYCEQGRIYDMEFMPDNNYFILMTATDLQIRETETGEIFKSYPIQETFADQKFAFTPDSTKLIIALGNRLEIRELSDMSIIRKYTMPDDPEGLNLRFRRIAVDPVLPVIYVLYSRIGTLSGGYPHDERRIKVFNYETMEFVNDITPDGYETEICEQLAVSIDGKYLAAINRNQSKILVFDLNSYQVISEYNLMPKDWNDKLFGVPSHIKFSELNTDHLFFSGTFPLEENDQTYMGIFIYNVSENRLIDSTFGYRVKSLGQHESTTFHLIDNEERAMVTTSGTYFQIVNFITGQKNETFSTSRDSITFGNIIIQNISNKFIGCVGPYYSMIIFDSKTGLAVDQNITLLYPNPTTGIVHIETDCMLPINYFVYDQNGIILLEDEIYNHSGVIEIDLSSFTSGIYFISVSCGNTIQTYKVIKEN